MPVRRAALERYFQSCAMTFGERVQREPEPDSPLARWKEKYCSSPGKEVDARTRVTVEIDVKSLAVVAFHIRTEADLR